MADSSAHRSFTPDGAGLEAAYFYADLGSEYLRIAAPVEKFHSHKDELAATLREFPYLIDLVVRQQALDDAKLALHAAILLRVKAGNAQRKNSKFWSYRHSVRLIQIGCGILDGLHFDAKYLIKLAIKKLLHDGPEDFGITQQEIKKIFGEDIARSVLWMTTPPKENLVQLYPDIAARYISVNDTASPAGKDQLNLIENHLQQLKESDLEKYIYFTAELKLQFKLDMARGVAVATAAFGGFGFDETFIKGIDNADALQSDIDDIDDGSLVLYFSKKFSGPAPTQGPDDKKHYMSTAEAEKKIADRIKYHEEGIMYQFDRLIERSKEAGHTVEAQRLETVKTRLDRHFQNVVQEYQSSIIRATNVGLDKIVFDQPYIPTEAAILPIVGTTVDGGYGDGPSRQLLGKAPFLVACKL